MANSSGGVNYSNQGRKAYSSFSTWVVSDHDQTNSQNSFEFPNFNSPSLPISPSQASCPSSYGLSPSVPLDSPLSFSDSSIFSSATAVTFPGVMSNNNDDTQLSDFSFHSRAWPWAGPSFENNSSEELFSAQEGTWTSNTSKKQTVLPTAFIGVKSEGVSTQNVFQKIPSTQAHMMQNSYFSQSNQIHRTQSSQLTRQRRESDDGYKWKKYGHKQVKASENPRSYYKCTYPNCLTKKKVETNLDGEITEIVYKGSHNHSKPQPTGGSLLLQSFQNRSFTSSEISIQSNHLLFNDSRKDSAQVQENSPTSFGDDDFDQVFPMGISRDDDTNELEAKRWKGQIELEGLSASGSGNVQDPRIVVQTTSDIDILDDGYRWRKYGQKVVKGNSNPRSYYKCTYMGCPVRKHIERAPNDLRSVITTYEGKHNHEVPAARGSGSYRSSSVDSNNKGASQIIRPLVISNRSNHGTNFLQSIILPTTSSQHTLQMLQNPESLRLSGLGSSANLSVNQVQDMGNNFHLAKEGPTDGLFFDSFLN